MQCPKCKNPIAENILRCPKCNLKVRIVCPECKTVNRMGSKSCSCCGYEFFLKCPECGAINLSTTDYCRKCGEILTQKENFQTDLDTAEKESVIVEAQQNTTINESEDENSIENEPEQEEPQIIPSEQIIDEGQPEINEKIITDNDNIAEGQASPTSSLISESYNVDFVEPAENIEIINIEEIGTSDVLQENDSAQTENSEQKNIEQSEERTEDDFMISSDANDISDEQLKDLFEKVEEIDRNRAKKAEAEARVRERFEQQEELENETTEEIPPEYIQLNQQDAQTAIINGIQNPLKKIISLNGKEGLGKTLILKYVRESLRQNNYIWAWGECNALTQITPFGYLQDVLLNLFNLSNFCANIEDFIKNNTKALEAQFYNLNKKEVNDLLNFLYPVKTSDFNGILTRKEYTISIIKKVFENMSIKSLIVFVVDDFENIDGASYDFLKNIIEDEKFNEKIKIVITNRHNKIAQGYFYSSKLTNNSYSNIFLSPLNNEQCKELVDTLYGITIDFPYSVRSQINEKSKGSSVYIEQACLLLNEMGAIKESPDGGVFYDPEFEDYILPNSTYKIIEERMNFLEKNNPILVSVLYYACLLGNKFSIHQFENVLQFLKISKEDFQQICNFLESLNYLTTTGNENYLMFNNTTLWHYIFERAKTDENYIEYNNHIYACVQYLTLSNNSLKPLLLRNANNKKEEYIYWCKNTEIASYLGDTNLYVISMKQQLKIADEIPDTMTAQERINIFEHLGKLLYKISPKETMNYLSAAIAYYKEKDNYNPVKIIELSGFLSQACNQSEDYYGVIETCDVALTALPDGQYEVEKALITSKKLNALLYLGNFEEVVNISKTELLEVMETALAKTKSSLIVTDENIFEAWFETCLNLASAYALKGDKKALEILSNINTAIEANKIGDINYLLKSHIRKPLVYSFRGDIKKSSEILLQIKSKYPTYEMSEEFVLRWNFINIINKILSMDYWNIAEEMFQVTTFADNTNNNFIKNMLKLLLGYVIQTKSKNTKKALEIYNEEIVYFSKEKIATGALLCWFLISTVSIISKGLEFSLDIALKALDVAKSPKIGNYLFIIALKRQIAEIYVQKRDYEAANMYLEKALNIATQNDLKFMQMLIMHSYAKYYEELISENKETEAENIKKTQQAYRTATKLSQTLMLSEYESIIVKDYTAFKVSCQLKNITVTEED